MQTQKSTRRKRKDPQSRDFTCSCGKTYLSYAAAYTHVKNKHKLDKKFLDDIGKPPREKLPRGRPREKKQTFTTKEIQRLSIIQDTILKMHECLISQFPKMILQGNKILTPEECQEADQKVMKSMRLHSQSMLKVTAQDYQFIKEINRHFAADIAAKVKFTVLVLSTAQNQRENQPSQSPSGLLNQLKSYNLWDGIYEVNDLIYEALSKWKNLGEE